MRSWRTRRGSSSACLTIRPSRASPPTVSSRSRRRSRPAAARPWAWRAATPRARCSPSPTPKPPSGSSTRCSRRDGLPARTRPPPSGMTRGCSRRASRTGGSSGRERRAGEKLRGQLRGLPGLPARAGCPQGAGQREGSRHLRPHRRDQPLRPGPHRRRGAGVRGTEVARRAVRRVTSPRRCSTC